VIAALRPGRTLEDFRQALRRARRGPGPVLRVATLEASGGIPPRGRYATTIELRPGVTYVVANIGENAARAALATFTVGATSSGAVRPTPAATIAHYDYAFAMPNTLPRRGTIRFENSGERLHMAIAFPLRRGASRAAAIRAFLRNQERRAQRLVDERGIQGLQSFISPGTVNDVEVDFRRPGNWVLVCFVEDGERGDPPHNTLGMVKAFRVR